LGPHSHKIRKKSDEENETFECEFWPLQRCTLLKQNSLNRKRRRNANAASAQANLTPRCLPRAMKEKQRTQRKGKRWEVMTLPVRGSRLTPRNPTSSGGKATLPNCWCPGFAEAKAGRQAAPKLGPQKAEKRKQANKPQ